MKRRGRPPYPDLLTPREWDVLLLLTEGRSNSEIADQLGISYNGVKYHVSHILAKLGVESREEAAAWQAATGAAPKSSFLGLKGLLLTKLSGGGKLAAGGVLVTAVGGFVLLAIAVLLSRGGSGPGISEAPPGKLAYVTEDGRIWTKEVPGGAEHPVGRGHAPRWSPSGLWLSFDNGEDFVITTAEGASSRLVETRELVWAPDTDRFAYVDAIGEIVVEDASGTNRRVIARAPAGPIPAPYQLDPRPISTLAWSPDGARLAYALTVQSNPNPGSTELSTACPALKPAYKAAPLYTGPRYSGLWLTDAHGSTPVQVFDSGGDCATLGRVSVAGWSGDGESIFFWIAPGFAGATADGLPLYAVSATGGEAHQRSFGVPEAGLIDARSQSAAMAVTAGSGRAIWTAKRLAVVDADTGGVSFLTEETTSAFSPSWSPDGSIVAYVAAPDVPTGGGDLGLEASAQRRIWLAQPDGSGKRRLTSDEEYREERPLWSSDGTSVLFVRLDSEGTASLWLAQVSGGTPMRIATSFGHRLPGYEANGYYGYIWWDAWFGWWSAP